MVGNTESIHAIEQLNAEAVHHVTERVPLHWSEEDLTLADLVGTAQHVESIDTTDTIPLEAWLPQLLVVAMVILLLVVGFSRP